MRNLLEPWVLVNVLLGVVSASMFARAAWTGLRVVRHFDVSRAHEGQLALERHLELASTYVQIASFLQVVRLALLVLAADRLSHGIRGAMCGYGVFDASPSGFRALGGSLAVAVFAGVLSQLFAFDRSVRAHDLAKTLAIATIVLLPVAIADLFFVTTFVGSLDLTVVASCCSVSLDSAAAGTTVYGSGPRVPATIGAVVSLVVATLVAFAATWRPSRPRIVLAGAAAFCALPFALAASVLEVAPFAFETPRHVCPFCLLKPEVFGLGYFLFGSLFAAAVWSFGATVSALVARSTAAEEALGPFARTRLRRAAVGFSIALGVGSFPVLRYLAMSHGASLFP